MKKKVLSLPLALALCLSLAVPAFAAGPGKTAAAAEEGRPPAALTAVYTQGEESGVIARTSPAFTDVRQGDWFYDSVRWAVEKGITNGTTAATFSPKQDCTVAQILTFLWRASGSPKPEGEDPFRDVKAGDWFADTAVWAHEKGMVAGNSFRADTPCTRSMAVTYLWKAAGSPEAETASFADVPASADYAQAVNWAVEQGITDGTSAKTFSPDTVCSRGQIMTFLYRAENPLKETGTSSDWSQAYAEFLTQLLEESKFEHYKYYHFHLAHIDGDSIPELLILDTAYNMEIYTYRDGKVLTIMDYFLEDIPNWYDAGVEYFYAPGQSLIYIMYLTKVFDATGIAVYQVKGENIERIFSAFLWDGVIDGGVSINGREERISMAAYESELEKIMGVNPFVSIKREGVRFVTEANIEQLSREPNAFLVPGDRSSSRYQYILDDCSWTEASNKAWSAGGYLARITDKQEYNKILSDIRAKGMTGVEFRIGARREPDQKEYHWVYHGKTFGEKINADGYWANSEWLAGEPSFQWNGNREEFVSICYDGNRCVWNDMADEVYQPGQGKYGYIVEFDEIR